MKDILKNSYDKSAESYDEKFYAQQLVKYKKLFKVDGLAQEIHSPILDLGCGTGLLREYFKGKYSFIGLDFSLKMLMKAKEKGIVAVQADIEKLPFKDESFQTVAAVTVLRIIPYDEMQVLKEIWRILKGGGVFIFSILEKNFDKSLFINLKNFNFNVEKEIKCGNDIGFWCTK